MCANSLMGPESETQVHGALIFQILEADVQGLARHKIGRSLTKDELHSVRKGVEGGLCFWEHVVHSAIDEAVRA